MPSLRAVPFIALIGLLLLPATSPAKSIEELLVEKQILTADEVKNLKPSIFYAYAPAYVPGEGMSMSTPDGNYRMNINLFLQGRYTFIDYDEDRPNVGEAASQWQLPRLYLNLKGNAYSRDLTYRLMINFGSGTATTLDAWIDYRVGDPLQIRAGQMTVPWSRQSMTSATAQQFTDRSEATNAFKPDYDTGLIFSGDFWNGIVAYNLGTYAGVGLNTVRNRDDAALLGRLECNPLGKEAYVESDLKGHKTPYLSVGGAIFYNRLLKGVTTTGSPMLESTAPPYASSTGWLGQNYQKVGFAVIEELEILEWEGDLNFKWQGFSTQAEYYRGKAEGTKSGEELEADGYYVQAGYFILPQRLEVAVRYSFVDPSMDLFRDDRREKQGVINWYFKGNTLKLQAEYAENRQQNAISSLDTLDRRYRLQGQLLF